MGETIVVDSVSRTIRKEEVKRLTWASKIGFQGREDLYIEDHVKLNESVRKKSRRERPGLFPLTSRELQR